MARIAYVNGRYLPLRGASVHIEDRGYQFADGIYEVMASWRGSFIDETWHLDRMDRSLAALGIAAPMGRAALKLVLRQILVRNRLTDALIYLQVTRGVAKRDHPFPVGVEPSLVITARRLRLADARMVEEGVGVITIPDIRWKRCDIKSISLLPNVLGKQQAREAGAYEAWQIGPDGNVTEGTSTNAWIVTQDGTLITHPADNAILNGITRMAVLELARAGGIKCVERPFSLAEAKAAREAFLTSTTLFVLPVVSINGDPVGNGHPGSITLDLRQRYENHLAGLVGA